MEDYDANNCELRNELAKHYPNGAKICDPFSGRAMIPLEAARLGIQAWGIDYSPVATLAGKLLADYPLRELGHRTRPTLRRLPSTQEPNTSPNRGFLRDVRFVLDLVARTLRGSRWAGSTQLVERQAPMGIPVGCHAAVLQLR